jgi:hypothetical protein
MGEVWISPLERLLYLAFRVRILVRINFIAALPISSSTSAEPRPTRPLPIMAGGRGARAIDCAHRRIDDIHFVAVGPMASDIWFKHSQPFAHLLTDGGQHRQFWRTEMIDDDGANIGYMLRSCGLDQLPAP